MLTKKTATNSKKVCDPEPSSNKSYRQRPKHVSKTQRAWVMFHPPWLGTSHTDSPVGGTDAKHQIVIGLFVLGSLKIPRRAVEVFFHVAGRPVMLEGGFQGCILPPKIMEVKNVPTNTSYLSNTIK